MSAYADDVTHIVSKHKHIDLIGEARQEYEAVTGAKINPEKIIGLTTEHL